MTIKEFASLCGCNTQTLRCYDKIDLLKPVKVDLRYLRKNNFHPSLHLPEPFRQLPNLPYFSPHEMDDSVIKVKGWFYNILLHYSLLLITSKNRLWDLVKSEQVIVKK